MEQICRKLGYGPFSTVRGHVYEALEAVVKANGQKPLTLNEAIFKAIEDAKPSVTVPAVADSAMDGDPRRRCWPLVNEMLQRLLPKSNAVLTKEGDNSVPITPSWGAGNKTVLDFVPEWREYADGVIVFAVITEMGELSERQLFDLAGLLHYGRDTNAVQRTNRIVELLLDNERLESGFNAAGEAVLRAKKPLAAAVADPQKTPDSETRGESAPNQHLQIRVAQ